MLGCAKNVNFSIMYGASEALRVSLRHIEQQFCFSNRVGTHDFFRFLCFSDFSQRATLRDQLS
jgi:hypothetical protein